MPVHRDPNQSPHLLRVVNNQYQSDIHKNPRFIHNILHEAHSFDQESRESYAHPASSCNGLHSIHPILFLPSELISLIFLHCLPSLDHGRQELHPSKAPLLLTRICGTWRTIALQTPALWASVAFEPFYRSSGNNPVPHAKLLELRLRKLAWWLAQGAAHPLTLYLQSHQDLPGAVPLLMAQTERWTDVDLFLHPTTLLAFESAVVKSGELGHPLLRRLSLGCSPLGPLAAGADVERAPRITAFANAPRLTDVSLLKLRPSVVALPWGQLTSFYASYADLDDVVRVLRLAPALQRLQLQHWPPLSPVPGPGEAESEDLEANLVHESLTYLTLRMHPGMPVPLSLLLRGGLTLPSLSSLTVPPLVPSDIPTFVAFASRSRLSYSLRDLTLALGPFPRGAILELLSPLKKLERLELRYPGEEVLGDILRCLTAGDATESGDDIDADAEDETDEGARAPFLPHLRELHIDCFREKVPYAALRAALEARWDVGSKAEEGARWNRKSLPVQSRLNPSESWSCCKAAAALTSPPSKGSASEYGNRRVYGTSVTQLRSFALTTLASAPKPATVTKPHPGANMQPEPNADAVHLAALQVLKARGMDVSVAYVYGEKVV